MSMHPVDPREPDGDRVETMNLLGKGWGYRFDEPGRNRVSGFESEAAALAAARAKRGIITRVADRPCATFTPTYCELSGDDKDDCVEGDAECDDCAWPRSRHASHDGHRA
jgi:hypothetical protein